MNKLTAEEISTEIDKFEAWFVTHRADWDKDCIHRMSYKNGIGFASGYMQAMWTAWKARVALEIALPVLEQQGGWISCSERMPEKTPDSSVEYLVYETLNDRVAHDYFNVPEGVKACQAFWNHYGSSVTHWMPLPAPPQPQPSTPQIDNDGWIDWGGGEGDEMPVEESKQVELRWSNGSTSKGRASNFGWANRVTQGFHSIIAYRVIENDGREG